MKTRFPYPFSVGRWAAAALLLAGCTDREGAGPTVVNGQVVESSSRRPVPRSPQVQLWQRRQTGGSLTGGAAYIPIGAPQPTDAEGRFAFSFEAEATHEYVLRADDAGLGYYTDWAAAPRLAGGRGNAGVQLPVYAPCWVRIDLVDTLPRSQVNFFFSGFGGGGSTVPYPRDTTLYFRYIAGGGQQTFIYWRITQNGPGPEVTDSRTFIQPPLDTQRIQILF